MFSRCGDALEGLHCVSVIAARLCSPGVEMHLKASTAFQLLQHVYVLQVWRCTVFQLLQHVYVLQVRRCT